MAAVCYKHDNVVAFLLKYGANPQLSSPSYGTAADVSRSWGTSAEQTEYIEARTHCAMPGCSGVGAKKCAGCLRVYYCNYCTGRRIRLTANGAQRLRRNKTDVDRR
jgi:hypothetical protein